MRRHVLFLAFSILLITASDAAAQQAAQPWTRPWTDRGYFNFNVGFEGGADPIEGVGTFRVYDADGSLTSSGDVGSGAVVDLAGGVRVWRNVSVGLGFHRGSRGVDGTLEGSVPNPFSFVRPPRPVSLSLSDLDRTERAVHLLFGYMLPLTDRIDAHVSLGPSFFRLKQEVPRGIQLPPTEGAFPYATVTVTPQVGEESDSAAGFNIGVDLSYRLYERNQIKLGGGMYLRYAGASGEIRVLDSIVDSDVGGLQFGIGARVRF